MLPKNFQSCLSRFMVAQPELPKLRQCFPSELPKRFETHTEPVV